VKYNLLVLIPETRVLVGERGSLSARIGLVILNLLFLVLRGSKYWLWTELFEAPLP
jgi:hypothetical protein